MQPVNSPFMSLHRPTPGHMSSSLQRASSMRSLICPPLLPPRLSLKPPQEMDFLAPAKLWIGCDLCYSQHEASSTGPPSLLLHQPFRGKRKLKGESLSKVQSARLIRGIPLGKQAGGRASNNLFYGNMCQSNQAIGSGRVPALQPLYAYFLFLQ